VDRNDIDIVEKTTAYQGYFRVDHYRLRHRLFAGGWSNELSRELFERGHATGILPYDPKTDCVVLIEQLRMGALSAIDSGKLLGTTTSPWLLECPAGIIEEGESPEEVARREVLEETGCQLNDIIPVRRFLASPGGSSESVQVFCGRVSAPQDGEIHGMSEENEDIRVRVLPVEEAFRRLEAGAIVDSLSVIALQWFQLHHHEVRARWAEPLDRDGGRR
jgi:ADP-ribose pyrophosphatase